MRRRLPVLAGALLLLVMGVTSYAIGREVDKVPPRDPGASVSPSATPGGSAGQLIALSAAQVVDFDPAPGDGAEGRATVPNAVDDDPTTAWETERYDSAALGGLKSGVGLLVDLGAVTSVGRVELLTSGGAMQVELRVADEPAAGPEGYRVVASGTAAQPGVVLTPPDGTTGRWWLLWVTQLREVDRGFSAAVAEMRFLRD